VTSLVSDVPRGIIISNPPYGERIGDQKAIDKIYIALNRFFKSHPDWSLFLVTTDKDVEQAVAERPADRRRKLYNGRLEVCYYQFHGEK
jgi:putative N6-adenine-specific DNA methylase